MNSNKTAQPERTRITWWPLIFTFFIGLVFVGPYLRHAGGREWVLVTLGVVVSCNLSSA